MSRPDMTLPTAPTAATQATASNMTGSRPAAALPAAFSGSGNFASTFQQVQGDIAAFISDGSGPSMGTPQLSAEGMALWSRASGLGAGAIAGSQDGGADSALQQQFLASIKPWAEETGQRLGVSPAIVSAHAALESGWGQRPLRTPDGRDSNNLFGLKATGRWDGAVTAAATTEYEHGAMLKKVERFRSYPDQAAAFRDYATMLTDNPRYQQALGVGNDARAFATGLARGGYATDPAYADKLTRLADKLQSQLED